MLLQGTKSRLNLTLLCTLLLFCSSVVAVFVFNFKQLETENIKEYFSQVAVKTAASLANFQTLNQNSIHPSFQLRELGEIPSLKAGFVFNSDWELLYQHVTPSFAREIQQYMYRLTDPNLQVVDTVIIRGDIYIVKKIANGEQGEGFLMIVGDFQEMLESRVKRFLYRSSVWGVPLFFLFLLVFIYLQRKAFKPVDALVLYAGKLLKSKEAGFLPDTSFQNEEFRTISNAFSWALRSLQTEKKKHTQTKQQLYSLKQISERMSKQDQLTGLVSRNIFMSLLDEKLLVCESEAGDVGLFYVDLDSFSDINQRSGFEFGDRVLIKVARTLVKVVGEDACVSRLAGDGFLIFMIQPANTMSITLLAQSLIKCLNGVLHVDEKNVLLGASMGIAFAKETGYNGKVLLENATVALKQAKESGKGKYSFYDASLMSKNRRSLTICNTFESAVKNNRLDVFYQPRVNGKGELVGFEALTRWEHEQMGEVRPDEFIPIIENNGMAQMLTSWLLGRVFQEVDVIQSMLQKELLFTVNLSHCDIQSVKFIPFLQALLEESSINPASIEFDITESVFVQNIEASSECLKKLKQLGFTLALENFGTSYSSVSSLIHPDIGTVKLDRAWMDSLHSGNRELLVVSSVIDMAHNLNLKVCAEGIETTEQYKMMLGLGCELLQGYLFGRPMPLDKLPAFFSGAPAYSIPDMKAG